MLLIEGATVLINLTELHAGWL